MTAPEILLELYREGFPEDGDYAECFVAEYARFAFTLDVGGVTAAAGYLLPKTAVVAGKRALCGYLDAFTARTAFRGKGAAPKLMDIILSAAREQGMRYVFLSPFRGDYYRRYGFVDVTEAEYRVIEGGQPIETRPARAFDIQTVYERMIAGCDTYLERGADFYRACAADHILVGREPFAAGTVFNGEFEVTACVDYPRLLKAEALKGLTVAVPGKGEPLVQAVDLLSPGAPFPKGKTCIIDKL